MLSVPYGQYSLIADTARAQVTFSGEDDTVNCYLIIDDYVVLEHFYMRQLTKVNTFVGAGCLGNPAWEDAVTGSSHCALIPYWANRQGKNNLLARQLSERGGELFCQNLPDKVIIGGRAMHDN